MRAVCTRAPSTLTLMVAMALAFAACVTVRALPLTAQQVEQARTRWPEATPESLEQGRVLLCNRCNGCHVTPSPSERRADAWPSEVDRMSARAHLTPEQAEQITRYLQAAASP